MARSIARRRRPAAHATPTHRVSHRPLRLPTRKTQGCASSSAQGRRRRFVDEEVTTMARYEITLKDHTMEVIDDADAYQQEGPMTTFFSIDETRRVVDCWSTRVASFRTSEIMIVRRLAGAGTASDQGTYAPSQAMVDSATIPPPSTAITARST